MKKLVLVAFLLVNVSAFSADSDGSGAVAGRIDNSYSTNGKADSDGSGGQPKKCAQTKKGCENNDKVSLFDWFNDLLR